MTEVTNEPEFTTQDQHAPTPPSKDDPEVTTLDQHAPAPPSIGEVTTLDQHAPAPPALDRDGPTR
ncbi:sigma-like protein [Streptomyces sp. SMS_SU21]|uniref:sigma-like protein n=1 Tax=Streptomyces sp. SMS_SU21 TaxID=2069440 RepID=UPI001CDA2D53|nr:sigma-like protein [Streptomyces sp. SMS_SU21]MCA2204045.1 sigma-like protein [Streptomyces sp. SMS_SU21]